MKILLDTTVLIDHLRGSQGATKFLSEAVTHGDELCSVTIVRTEVLAGMRENEEKTTRALLGQIQWFDVDIEMADAAGALAEEFLKSHPGVDTVDYILAAAANGLRADLATTNVKHFPMFPDLEPPY